MTGFTLPPADDTTANIDMKLVLSLKVNTPPLPARGGAARSTDCGAAGASECSFRFLNHNPLQEAKNQGGTENNVDPLQQAAKADAEAKATNECARFCKGAKHHIPLSSVIYDIAPFHLPLVFQACVFLLIKLFRAPTARTCFRLSLLT